MITLSIKGGAARLDAANIFYIESQGHTLIFYTASGSYETFGTMRDMELKLEGMNFCRGNKGYLINLAYVESIKESCAIVKGKQLLLSRSRKKDFMEALTRYWGEMMK